MLIVQCPDANSYNSPFSVTIASFSCSLENCRFPDQELNDMCWVSHRAALPHTRGQMTQGCLRIEA